MCRTLLHNFALTTALYNFLCSFCSHYISLLLLLLVRNGLLRALAGTCVGLGALTANRQATAMTQAAVAADLNQTLDVEADLTAQVTLYGVAVLDALTQLCCFFLSQILNAGVRVDTGLGQDFVGQLPSDAVDVGQADLYALLTRKVNTGNTCNLHLPPKYLAGTCVR